MVRLDAAAKSYEIVGTDPYVKYAYQIGTENEQGAGPKSECGVGFSGESEPSGRPTSLRVVQVTSNSALFAWDAIPAAQLNGKLIGYKVQYKQVQEGFEKIKSLQTDQIEEAELLKLKPATDYEITVSAVNGAGPGPKSSILIISTKEDFN